MHVNKSRVIGIIIVIVLVAVFVFLFMRAPVAEDHCATEPDPAACREYAAFVEQCSKRLPPLSDQWKDCMSQAPDLPVVDEDEPAFKILSGTPLPD